MPKVYPVSLGCPKNKVDFEKLLFVLSQRGYEFVLTPEEADVLWINTCAFIRPAVEEAIDHILELGANKRENQKLVVSGCLTSRYGESTLKELLPEVDEFYSIEPYKAFVSFEPLDRIFTESPFYSYLKVAEGCNRRCSFCTIPKIRGNLKSRPIKELVEETKRLLDAGVKEIVLVSQDLTQYGRDLGMKNGLVRLLESLNRLDYEFRIRMLYLHPSGISKEFVKEVLGFEKLVPYFEVPIQHAHPKILKLMNRSTNIEKLKEILFYIRELCSVAALRSTVIVGFPEEGEEEFEYLCNFLKEVEFDYLGAFIFYPEEGTPAERFRPRVKYKEKIKRRRTLLKLQKEITKLRLARRKGLEEEVLILGEDVRGRFFGISRFQAPEIDGVTYIKSKKKLIPGTLIKGKIIKTGTYDVWIRPDKN